MNAAIVNDKKGVKRGSRQDAVVIRETKKKKSGDPQLDALTDFFRYKVITSEQYQEYRNILMNSKSVGEKDRVMRKVRAML